MSKYLIIRDRFNELTELGYTNRAQMVRMITTEFGFLKHTVSAALTTYMKELIIESDNLQDIAKSHKVLAKKTRVKTYQDYDYVAAKNTRKVLAKRTCSEKGCTEKGVTFVPVAGREKTHYCITHNEKVSNVTD